MLLVTGRILEGMHQSILGPLNSQDAQRYSAALKSIAAVFQPADSPGAIAPGVSDFDDTGRAEAVLQRIIDEEDEDIEGEDFPFR